MAARDPNKSWLDKDGDGKVTLDELLQSASAFENAFGLPDHHF